VNRSHEVLLIVRWLILPFDHDNIYLVADGHLIPGVQLALAARLDLSIDEHLAALDEALAPPTRGNQSCQL
jgi:hypothetical protein